MQSRIIPLKQVITDYKTRTWCKLPYPNHPKGCPNYNQRNFCPPKVHLFHQIIKPPFTLIAVKFNLKEHAQKMKNKHSKWTDRQAKCILYWQKKVDKQLRELSEKTASKIPNSKILYRPEATGVDLFKTCKKVGLILKKDPQDTVWKISIIGIKK